VEFLILLWFYFPCCEATSALALQECAAAWMDTEGVNQAAWSEWMNEW